MILLRLVRFYRRIRHRRLLGVGLVVLLVLICILGNSVCFYVFDGRANEDLTFADALWYSVISITTIGYGDYRASSLGARMGTIVFISVMGLATFSVFLGMSIDWATDVATKGQRGMSAIIAHDHILIVNFPSAARVSQLIQELKSDPQHEDSEIVIATDQVEMLPFEEKDVLFVHGSILEQDTYSRAKVAQARMVIVLATSYSDANSDAIVASAIAVIDSLNPNIYIVAECLNYRHKMLFDSVNCNSVVFSMRISTNLLAQEAHDPGVSQLVEVLTSNVRGTTLFSTEVSDPSVKDSYSELAKRLLDKNVNILCVNRGDECLTSFVSLAPQLGDRVVYAASERLDWTTLLQQAGT